MHMETAHRLRRGTKWPWRKSRNQRQQSEDAQDLVPSDVQQPAIDSPSFLAELLSVSPYRDSQAATMDPHVLGSVPVIPTLY